MSKQKLLIGAFVLLSLVLVGCTKSYTEQASGDARLEVEQRVDLGIVQKGEVKTKTVPIKNTGTGTLLIQKISTSCDCTQARVSSKRIESGGEGSLEISYNSLYPGQVPGRLSRMIYIQSNDASNPQTVIEMQATLQE